MGEKKIWASEEQNKQSEWGWGHTQVNGRGYTHSIVAGVAFREPSCQFSTGTGMQVSLMVSWQRRDRGGPLSSSSWALLWTVSTTEGGGGAEGSKVRGFRGREPGTQMWGRGGREKKKERRQGIHKNIWSKNWTWDKKAVKPLVEPTSFEPQELLSHPLFFDCKCTGFN